MTDLTLEELEQLAVSKSKPKVVKVAVTEKSRLHVSSFVIDLKLKDGTCEIPNYVLYYKYCREWNPTGRKLSKIGFARTFSKFFDIKRKTKVRYYNLNLKITEEYKKEAKEFDRLYGRKRITRRVL